MKIKDRPEFGQKPKPLTCRPDTSVSEAVSRMSQLNYGSIVVVDESDRVKGLVTERDIMKRLVDKGRDAVATKVSEIMTSDVRVAKENDELQDWLRIMSNERFRRLPIVDGDGKIVSIMTQGDFVSYTWPDLVKQATTLAKTTTSSNYPIMLIFGGILLYTIVLIAMLGQ